MIKHDRTTNGKDKMSNELKPCPMCGDKAEVCTTEYSQCRSEYYIACLNGESCPRTQEYRLERDAVIAWNDIPRLSTEQQKWLELAPEFDTEKYEYLWDHTPSISGDELYNGASWMWNASSVGHHGKLLRRTKQPELTVVKSDACIHVKRNGKLHESISIRAYEAIKQSEEQTNDQT